MTGTVSNRVGPNEHRKWLYLWETANEFPYEPNQAFEVTVKSNEYRAGAFGVTFVMDVKGFESCLIKNIVPPGGESGFCLSQAQDEWQQELVELYQELTVRKRGQGTSKDGLWSRAYKEYQALNKMSGVGAPLAYAFGCMIERKADRFDARPAIGMELLDENDGWCCLSDAVNGLPRSAATAALVGSMLSAAICRANKNHLVHRDISGGNVWIKRNRINGSIESLKLIDFGQAANVNGTYTTNLWGTPSFASPEMIPHSRHSVEKKIWEQLRKNKTSPGSDVWSIGAVMYYVRTGKKPSSGLPENFLTMDPLEGYAHAIEFKMHGLTLPNSEDDSFRGSRGDEDLDEIIRNCTKFVANDRPKPADLCLELQQLIENNAKVEQTILQESTPSITLPATTHGETDASPYLRINPPAKPVEIDLRTRRSARVRRAEQRARAHGQNTPTDVYWAKYRVETKGNDGPTLLVLAATENGCVVHNVQYRGEKCRLLPLEGPLAVPGHISSEGMAPWTDAEVIYINEPIAPVDMSNWFANLKNLREVKSANIIDTSHVKALTGLFRGCEKIKRVDVSSWNTSVVENMALVFSGCSSLQSIDVSGWDTSAVNMMAGIFSKCSSIESLDVSSWNVAAVKDIEGVFLGCSNLRGLDVSEWDTSSAVDMSAMFIGCSSLQQLDVSEWDTSSAVDMGCMFMGCSSLQQLDVSRWDVSKTEIFEKMFADCSSLESLNLSQWDISSAKEMQYMFDGCVSLQILRASGWDMSKVERVELMFRGCQESAVKNVGSWKNVPARLGHIIIT